MTDTAQPPATSSAAPATPIAPALTDPPVVPVASVPVASVPGDVSQDDKLALFEQILDEAEQVSAPPSVSPPPPVSEPLPVSEPPSVPPPPPVPAPSPAPPPVETTADTTIETTIVPPGGLSVDAPVDSGVLTQALPMAVHQATDPLLNPANPAGTTAKERAQQTSLEDAGANATADVGTIQMVEQEPKPEISPEVEAYIQAVQDHASQAPREVVIADGTNESATTAYPSRPVVIVPITQQIEREGKHKSPIFSIRWLVEWSHKIIKIFAGKVLYRTPA